MTLIPRVRRSLRRLAGVLVLSLSAAALGPVPEVQAQGRGGPGGFLGGPGGFGDVLNPSVTSRDLDRYADILSLNPDQRAIVRELFGGYQEQYRAFAEQAREQMAAVRERMEAARGEGGEAGRRDQRGGGRPGGEFFAAMRDAFTRLRGERERMERTFFEDVKTILTPEQAAQWPRVERLRRRETTMSHGFIAGENVDLFRLLERMNLPADLTQALTPTLEQYEVELDQALVARNKVQEEGIDGFLGGRFGRPEEGLDMEKAQRAFQEAREASLRLRDVNRRFARQIEAALPEDRRQTFTRLFNEASFPEVYRESPVVRNVSAALGFSDLTADQRTRLIEVRDQFLRESAPVLDRLAKAIEEQQATMTVDQLMARFRGGDDNSPLGQARQARRELERSFSDRVRSILTPEQIERLPQGEGRGGFRGEGRGERGGGSPAERGRG